MTCYHPIEVFQPHLHNDFYTRPISFDEPLPNVMHLYEKIKICCNRCVGCFQSRAGAWAMRCWHEASLSNDNCFITLTYNDEHLPPGASLFYRDFQLFMKRFKIQVARDQGSLVADRIRFFMCGEYGEQTARPHYHAAIFNYDFSDKYYWRRSPSGHRLYRSTFLEDRWSDELGAIGHCEIGDLTFDSAAYIARYIFKKDFGEDSDKNYGGRLPEFISMSRRPGIARAWFDKYWKDVFPHDYVIRDGVKLPVPRYYSDLYEQKTAVFCPVRFGVRPDRDVPGYLSPIVESRSFCSPDLEAVKFKRFERSQLQACDNTPDRLLVKEQLHKLRLARLKRSFL